MKIFLKIAGSVIVLIAAVLAYAGYRNYAAERAAQSFCAATPVGSELKAALDRGEQQRSRHRGPRTIDGKETHDFEFQGWVFNVGVCRVAVENGKVLSVVVQLEGD